mgnify:CR=1 FL=1
MNQSNLQEESTQIDPPSILAITDFYVYEENKLFLSRLTLSKKTLMLELGEGPKQSITIFNIGTLHVKCLNIIGATKKEMKIGDENYYGMNIVLFPQVDKGWISKTKKRFLLVYLKLI